MILENKTEVTVPAVMAMQKAMNRQGQLARYLIAGLFLLGAIWQIGYLMILGTWIQSYFYGILFCALVAGFLLIMPIWSNKKVLKQVTQQALQFVCTAHQSLLFSAADAENSG